MIDWCTDMVSTTSVPRHSTG